MNRATRQAHGRERMITDGESPFLRPGSCRPIALTERAVQLKLGQKILGKRRSKTHLEGPYKVLIPGFSILKVSPTT